MAIAIRHEYFPSFKFCLLLLEREDMKDMKPVDITGSRVESLEGRRLLLERAHDPDEFTLKEHFDKATKSSHVALSDPPGKLSIYNFQSPSKGRASFAPERTEDSIVARRFAVTFDDYDPLPVLLNATGSSMSLDRIILTGVKYPTIEDLKLKDIPEEVTALFGSVGPQ